MPQSRIGLLEVVLLSVLAAYCHGSPALLQPKGNPVPGGDAGVAFNFQHEVTIFGSPYKADVQHYMSGKNGRITFGSNDDSYLLELSKMRPNSMLHPAELFFRNYPQVAYAAQARLSGEGLREVEAIVRENFWSNDEFSAIGGHIFTWENQRSSVVTKENTVQAVIIYDQSSTYVLYNYVNVSFIEERGHKLLTGFSRGNSFDTVQLPFTEDSAVQLPQVSGLGNRTLGRYVYRIDVWPPKRGGCLTEDGDRVLSSTVLRDSVLGRNVAIVSGRCHEPGTSGTCTLTMDGATLGESPTIACSGSQNCTGAGVFLACDIPPAYRQGQAKLSLAISSIQGAFSTDISLVNPDDTVSGKIQLAGEFENWMKLSSQGLQITYDSTLRGILKLRVIGYSEAGLTQINTESAPMKTLLEVDAENDGQMDVSGLSCPSDTPECDTHHVGFLEIVDSGYPPRYLRSRILPLGWFVHKYYTDQDQPNWYRQKCSALSGTDEATQRIREKLVTLTCPGSLVQARADSSRYLRLGYCPELPGSCSSATPSQTCFVSRVAAEADQPSAPASICCYDATAGYLIYQDSIGAQSGNDWNQHGSRAIRSHPEGVAPAGNNPLLPGRVAFMSHWYWDALQFLYCCRWSNQGDCPFYFMNERPTPKVSSFVAGRGGGIVGDPHLTSFSGRPYLFNGIGEYWLQRTDNNFQVQGRFLRLQNPDNATFLVAVAVRVGTGATFQVSVTASAPNTNRFRLYRRVPDTGYQTEISLVLDKPYIEGGVTVRLASAENVVVQLTSNDQSMGIDLYAAANMDYMNAFVALSATLKGLTRGLLGQWTDNADNEFVDISGSRVAFVANASEFHHLFCKKNQLTTVDTSLFVYDGLRGNEFHRYNVDFVLQYEPRARFSAKDISAHGQEEEICISNDDCIFDIRVMQNTEIGRQTAEKSAEFGALQASTNETGRYCDKPSVRGLALSINTALTEGTSIQLSCGTQLQASRAEETVQCVRKEDGTLGWQPDPTTLGFSCQLKSVNPDDVNAANVGLIVGITVPIALLLIVAIIVVVVIVLRRRDTGNTRGKKANSGSSRPGQNVGASRTTIVSEGSTGGGIDNQGQANRRGSGPQGGAAAAAARDSSSSMGRQYETRQQQQQQQQQQQMDQSEDPRRSYNQAQMVPMEPAGEFNLEYASLEGQKGQSSRSEVV